MKELYSVEFRVDNVGQDEFKGFDNVKTSGYFEPGWSMDLLFHDIFEHWFEDTKYFRTQELSQAGECVAMGIRSYFADVSGLIHSYAGYNRYRGIEWNSWSTVISQCGENLDPDAYIKYPNDFNYDYLQGWNGENMYEDYVNAYNEYYKGKFSLKLKNEIEKAVSYGYWLGEKLFEGKIQMIDTFCRNLQIFLRELNILDLGMYDSSHYLIHGRTMSVSVREDNIVMRFCGVCISANMEEDTIYRQIKRFQNKFEYAY